VNRRLACAVLALLALGLVLGLGGCAKKRIPECDVLAKKFETIAACSKLPDDQRKTVLDSAKTIRDSLQMLEELGGAADAPADLVNSIRDTCKTQGAAVTQMYADCLK
jgi:hypothetical protein